MQQSQFIVMPQKLYLNPARPTMRTACKVYFRHWALIVKLPRALSTVSVYTYGETHSLKTP